MKASHDVHRLWKDGGSGAEYFLIENRQRSGYDSQLPGDGLLVWHIDDLQHDNNDPNHYKVGLLQADGKRDLELNPYNRGDAGDPYPGSSKNTSATDDTTPSTRSFTGQDTDVSITEISASATTMTATVSVSGGGGDINDVAAVTKKKVSSPKAAKKQARKASSRTTTGTKSTTGAARRRSTT